jgi:hypothetical protein
MEIGGQKEVLDALNRGPDANGDVMMKVKLNGKEMEINLRDITIKTGDGSSVTLRAIDFADAAAVQMVAMVVTTAAAMIAGNSSLI